MQERSVQLVVAGGQQLEGLLVRKQRLRQRSESDSIGMGSALTGSQSGLRDYGSIALMELRRRYGYDTTLRVRLAVGDGERRCAMIMRRRTASSRGQPGHPGPVLGARMRGCCVL